MFGMAMGANAKLKLSDEVKDAVYRAAEMNTRTVKIVIEAKKESLTLEGAVPATGSFETDFTQIQAICEAGIPAIILVRLAGHASNSETDWGLISWIPSDTPVKLRMLAASSQKDVKDAFKDLTFKTYPATDNDEVTWKAFREATAELSREERREAMSQAERDMEDVKEAMRKEQMAAPAKLAGMAQLVIKVLDSFTVAAKAMMDSNNKAVLGRLEGPKGEDLGGEVLEGVGAVSSLKGKLPADAPAYVLMKAHGELLLLSWLPENCPVKPRMKLSTFKRPVVEEIRKLFPSQNKVLQAEVSLEDWLTDDVGEPAKESEAAAAPKKPAAGYGVPMPGAVKMPGMPPGGFALPKRVE